MMTHRQITSPVCSLWPRVMRSALFSLFHSSSTPLNLSLMMTLCTCESKLTEVVSEGCGERG